MAQAGEMFHYSVNEDASPAIEGDPKRYIVQRIGSSAAASTAATPPLDGIDFPTRALCFQQTRAAVAARGTSRRAAA